MALKILNQNKNIKKEISEEFLKDIFGNANNCQEYLLILKKYFPQSVKADAIKLRQISSGKNKGRLTVDTKERTCWKQAELSWDYHYSKQVIRKMFEKSAKFQKCRDSIKNYNFIEKNLWPLVKKYDHLTGEPEWGFSQGSYDDYENKLIRHLSDFTFSSFLEMKREREKTADLHAIQKMLNTCRNDYIEYLLFTKSQSIIPTFSNKKGTDFFINGVPFDQKVSSSPTSQFMNDYGNNYKQEAIEHPEELAKYLYQYQDPGRFDYNCRILFVYLDKNSNINPSEIEKAISKVDLENPIPVNFNYSRSNGKLVNYSTKAIVVSLAKTPVIDHTQDDEIELER